MAAKSPTSVTIGGRLSFPNFEYATAVVRNQKSQFPKADPAEVTPDFNILLEPAQLQKFIDFVKQEFLPHCLEQSNKGEKRNALTDAEVKRLVKSIDAADWDDQPPYLPIKPINEKTALLAPECVANLKVVGNRGMDIEKKAVVTHEGELAIPDPNMLVYPAIVPIQKSIFSMYGGCHVAATINLYSYISGKLPGFSASASVCVFKAEGERFGGGVAVDEDAIFAD